MLSDSFTNVEAIQSFMDALTAKGALLDPDGFIVRVNKSWIRFSVENGGTAPHGVGSSYIGLLDQVSCTAPNCSAKATEDAAIARQVSQGIKKVTSGESEHFQLQYPCDSPTEKRWFLLTVARIRQVANIDVLVLHENITHVKQAEHKAQESLRSVLVGFQQMVDAIGIAIEKRDPYTAGHQKQVAAISVEVGRRLGFDGARLFGLSLGASIHDIGKISVPSDILCKPGRLSQPERMLLQHHAYAGFEIINGVSFPWPIHEMILQHHEKFDGTGYPSGLMGDEICLEARIISVADVFDALTAHRPYRPGFSRPEALDIIQSERGKTFDPEVLDAALPVISTVDTTWFSEHTATVPVPSFETFHLD